MVNWISELQPTEWPEGVIENMDPKILTAAVVILFDLFTVFAGCRILM